MLFLYCEVRSRIVSQKESPTHRFMPSKGLHNGNNLEKEEINTKKEKEEKQLIALTLTGLLMDSLGFQLAWGSREVQRRSKGNAAAKNRGMHHSGATRRSSRQRRRHTCSMRVRATGQLDQGSSKLWEIEARL